MPPSPGLRRSPSRELREENHKHGRNLEARFRLKEKDDDLELFNEMESRERENFLLQSSDDFEDAFSTKLRLFSDVKHGMSISIRGESSEMLNAEGDKNDYDWLLTPPDTPLFPSLDDEPQPIVAPRAGRPRKQPISMSRSSTMERSHRSSRGSPSPNRLSPSPRSGSGAFQSRERASSASRSSPTPGVRAATPTRRPSTPPSKPSTAASRSLTPTTRRMSTGSHSITSGVRGTSPVRLSRGNSASPKIRAWQSNIPGFNSDAPPNLRTSLADRPASYVRGSSPASRNGRDSVSSTRRQSMSPTASRSVSSSHSHDRDRLSSHSKGSVASSGDDDLDSLQSIPLGGSDRSVSKRGSPVFPKRSPRMLSSSAPKRSFDTAIRQMDHRKSPQNMFRPLLSSVPSTTLYTGKEGFTHHSMVSKDPAGMARGYVSSDQSTNLAVDTEDIDIQQDVLAESEKVQHLEVQEAFTFDRLDEVSEEAQCDRHDKELLVRLENIDCKLLAECDPSSTNKFVEHIVNLESRSASDTLLEKGDSSEFNSPKNNGTCTECGTRFHISESDEIQHLCPDCREQLDTKKIFVPDTVLTAVKLPLSVEISEGTELTEDMEVGVRTPVVLGWSKSEFAKCKEKTNMDQNSYSEKSSKCLEVDNVFSYSLIGDAEMVNNSHERDDTTATSDLPSNGVREGQSYDDLSCSKIDSSECAGISALLKRSNSIKGSFVQGRTFIAAAKLYEDLSLTRDSNSSLRSSTGYGSPSVSSSVDFTSSRHTDVRVKRQFSGKRSDGENDRFEMSSKSPSSISSLSGVSAHMHPNFGSATLSPQEHPENFYANSIPGELLVAPPISQGNLPTVETNVCVQLPSAVGVAIVGETFGITSDPSTSEVFSNLAGPPLDDESIAFLKSNENCDTYENASEAFPPVSDAEAVVTDSKCSLEVEQSLHGPAVDEAVVKGNFGQESSISEIEMENCSQDIPSSQADDLPLKSERNINEVSDLPVVGSSVEDIAADVPETNSVDNASQTSDKATIMVERQGSNKKSLTLEEATDTILFCRAIVNDLAYKAANVAFDKTHEEPVEFLQPTITILGKSNTERKDPRGRNIQKRAPKPQKSRQRHAENDVKVPQVDVENDENAGESVMRNVGLPNKVDSLKPPKLESKCNCTIM